MKKKFIYIFLISVVIISVLIAFEIINNKFQIKDYIAKETILPIQPDYSDTVIPPNIVPLNFYIKEAAERYYVKIYSKKGTPINIYSKSAGIKIPLTKWRRLLDENKGNELHFEIFVQKKDRWEKYKPIINKIAQEKIDSFLVYRYLYPQFYRKKDIKIYQRNLENYARKLIMDSQAFRGCFNCHTFLKNKPKKFIIQTRRKGEDNTFLNYMILNDNNQIHLITARLSKPGSSYLSWHPSGSLVALTMDMAYKVIDLFVGSIPEEKLEYIDTDANLATYNINTNTLTTTPEIAKEDRIEMQPAWSPDGRYLYFISAKKMPIEEYAQIKYDLMRISYDAPKNTWGVLETVISSADTGLSVTFPKISPDGRYVLFCMTDRGSLSIYRSSTDLYLMDIQTTKFRKLEINSDRTDSYHSWSSNSRWFVFVTKRDDGISARPYFCYIDEKGKVYKPFILPQKDPYFYDTFIKSYNAPELISQPLNLNRFSFGKKIRAQDKIIDTVLLSDLADIYHPGVMPTVEPDRDYQH